ncbi:MAG: mechanosensitive ion channel family protein [Promethearchaeota archaeon]
MFVQIPLEDFLINLISDLIFSDFLFRIALFIVGIIVIFIIQFLIIGAVKRIENIPGDVVNGIKFLLRLAIAIAVLMLIAGLFGLSPEALFFIAAVFGAIVSFSSAQVIQNFIAGLYLLFTRPFIVGDLVAIGDVEGVVDSISLNYTKIRTMDGLYQFTPNKNIMNTSIVNYNQQARKKALNEGRDQKRRRLSVILSSRSQVRYSFDWKVPIGDLDRDKAKIKQVCKKYTPIFGQEPKFSLIQISHCLKFKFIITTDTGEKIINFGNAFRNELVDLFH